MLFSKWKSLESLASALKFILCPCLQTVSQAPLPTVFLLGQRKVGGGGRLEHFLPAPGGMSSSAVLPLWSVDVPRGLQVRPRSSCFTVLLGAPATGWLLPGESVFRSGIAGSYANSVFTFLRNHRTIVNSDCTVLQ